MTGTLGLSCDGGAEFPSVEAATEPRKTPCRLGSDHFGGDDCRGFAVPHLPQSPVLALELLYSLVDMN